MKSYIVKTAVFSLSPLGKKVYQYALLMRRIQSQARAHLQDLSPSLELMDAGFRYSLQKQNGDFGRQSENFLTYTLHLLSAFTLRVLGGQLQDTSKWKHWGRIGDLPHSKKDLGSTYQDLSMQGLCVVTVLVRVFRGHSRFLQKQLFPS